MRSRRAGPGGASTPRKPRRCSRRPAHRPGSTLFILTVVTVLALPLMIIPGLFGMNVRGIPFSESDGGFWIIVVLVTSVVVLGAALAWTRRDRS